MITVMFASYNGGERLKSTLDSMARIQAPRGGWRLIAVDNRSTDGSHDVMLSFKDRLPIEALQEPSPGKNKALNRAVDLALADPQSDLFVFCDDDVLVAENWLVELRDAADAHPGHAAFAGLTLPHWPSQPPEWVVRLGHVGVLYGVHQDAPEGECDMRYMYGTNMAVRATIFRGGVRFNTAIGPNGSSTYAMGSETELGVRLAQQGQKCWFAGRAVVHHIIRSEQLDAAWVFKRAYRFGRGGGLMGEPHIMAIPPDKLAVKNTAKGLVYPWLLPALPEAEAQRRRWQWAYDQGYEDGARDRAGQPPRWSQA